MTTATTLGLAEPAVAAVLGLAALGEHLTATGFAGLGVLAASLAIAAWPARRRLERAAVRCQAGSRPGCGTVSTPRPANPKGY